MSPSIFKIDIKKLSDQPKILEYELSDSFFERFEQSPIKIGRLKSEVMLTKSGSTIEALIKTKGQVNAACDRCSASISLPISGQEFFLFKKDSEDWEDELTIMLDEGDDYFYIDQYLYEAAVLAMPMQKVYDCEDDDPRPCDDVILDKLENGLANKNKSNALAEQLKNIKIKNE